MKQILILILLISSIFTRNYPLYKQCDQQWANDQLGTSPVNTICRAGCLLSSSAMALKGTGHQFNPGTLNQWLKSNGGYVSDDLYVWAAINKLGLTFRGFINNANIKSNLDAGNVVILNVNNGGHWVLAYAYNGDNILVNDPGYSKTSYALTQIVNGNTGVYSISNFPLFFDRFYYSIKSSIYSILGIKEDLAYAQRPALQKNQLILQ